LEAFLRKKRSFFLKKASKTKYLGLCENEERVFTQPRFRKKAIKKLQRSDTKVPFTNLVRNISYLFNKNCDAIRVEGRKYMVKGLESIKKNLIFPTFLLRGLRSFGILEEDQ
jgi:hypothetical protein